MKYSIGKRAASTPECEIDEVLFHACKQSKEILSRCLAIEEKYEILLSNYLELENQILQSTTSYMVRGQLDYSSFFDLRLTLNIRLVNLLTSVRLYIDQIQSDVKGCLPNHYGINEIVKVLFSQHYDNNLNYRFMEALRNYTQHNGLAVHWTALPSRWTELGEKGLLEYNLEFGTHKAILLQDNKFKKQVLVEIPDQIDLKIATRSYIESMSDIHKSVRELIFDSVAKARSTIDSAYQQYEQIWDESLVGLSIYKYDGVRIIENIPLVREWDDIRIQLQKRNSHLVNLHKRYASGKSTV